MIKQLQILEKILYDSEIDTNLCFKFSIQWYIFWCMKGRNNTQKAGLRGPHLVRGSKKKYFFFFKMQSHLQQSHMCVFFFLNMHFF